MAMVKINHIAFFILSAEMSPDWVARVGPRRSSWSAPFSKSNTSLAKFVPIWIRTAAKRVMTQMNIWKNPLLYASAQPNMIGAMAAGRVFGLAARSQFFIYGVSWKPGKFFKFRFAFFLKRIPAFLGFICHIEKHGSITRKLL